MKNLQQNIRDVLVEALYDVTGKDESESIDSSLRLSIPKTVAAVCRACATKTWRAPKIETRASKQAARLAAARAKAEARTERKSDAGTDDNKK